MNRSSIRICALAAFAAMPGFAAAASHELTCSLSFSSREWSAVYESAVGSGTVKCSDGKSMPVSISAKGLGVTAGKWKIDKGSGKFTHVSRIDDVLGNYLAISGDVGLVKAGTAQALTKGKVSLVLAGKGEGFDVGVAVSDFRISKPETAAAKPAKPAAAKPAKPAH